MIWVIPALAVIAALALLSDSDKNGKDMANCNKLFLDFNKQISLTSTQKEKLRTSRKALEDKIRKALNDEEKVSFKGFYIQGSLSPRFNTGVLKKDGTYDVDLGVYLDEKLVDVTSTTVQKYVYDAVKDHTEAGASHLSKCVRVVYAGDFDVDLPVYYQGKDDGVPYIAIKNGHWRKDDPKGTSEWFQEKKKETSGQLVRIIKYLKIWADKDVRGFKMPSGFALTVWAAENFNQVEDRDDKSLLSTLKAIKNSIVFGVSCYAPKDPKDDLTANLTDDQKEKFKKALNSFIEDAEKAVASNNQLTASKLWKKHLYDFPEGLDEDVDAKEEKLRAMALPINVGIGKTDVFGNQQSKEGVPNPTHRNFGGNEFK